MWVRAKAKERRGGGERVCVYGGVVEYRALLIEYRALLIEYRALLIEYLPPSKSMRCERGKEREKEGEKESESESERGCV